MSNNVPDNLTFKQFKALADRKPSMEGNWLYRLTHQELRDDFSYPEFGLWERKYMFLSFDDAEKYMHEKLIPKNDRYDTYRYLIEQVPIGHEEDRTGATWVYDREGVLVETSITIAETYHKFPDSSFFGRSKERVRFREGDIVEVVDRDSVHLAIVAAEGPTVEQFWDIYQRSNSKRTYYAADRSDDCYFVIDGPGCHEHRPCTQIMKPSQPVSEDIKEYFEECLAMAKRKESDFDIRLFDMDSMTMFDAIETDVKLQYFPKIGKHKLLLRQINNITGEEGKRILPYPFPEEQVGQIAEWLGFKKYGKTRLWYLIREWNEYHRMDDEPTLAPDTSLEELLKVD